MQKLFTEKRNKWSVIAYGFKKVQQSLNVLE